MAVKKKKGVIAILTGGGDVPGLNPAIRAVTIRALREGYTVIGLRRGWAGIMELIRDKKADNSRNFVYLTREVVDRAGRTGGTFLHSSRTKPSKVPKAHVPKHLQDIVNKYGGDIKPTWGVPVEEIQLGIRNGVRKINVDTDNRLAITGAIRKVFTETPAKFDPRDYMKPAREAMQEVVKARMISFGQAGHSGDYTPLPLDEMAKMYAKG